MKKKLIVVALAVAVLVSAGVVAMRVGASEANVSTAAVWEWDDTANDRVSAQATEPENKPYIGIMIGRAGDKDRKRRGHDDADAESDEHNSNGATETMIFRVVEGSPADGKLQKGDVITALDGEAIEGPSDVVERVRSSQPNDAIVFSVARDGTSVDVGVTVGEHPAQEFRIHKGSGFDFDSHHGFFGGTDGLILSETRRQTDDGVQTTRKAVGTVQSVDAAQGTFNLLLRDGSETYSFNVNDDTKVLVEGAEDISGLNTTDTTLVVEVTNADGSRQVNLVAQGEAPVRMHNFFGRHGFDFLPHGFFSGEDEHRWRWGGKGRNGKHWDREYDG